MFKRMITGKLPFSSLKWNLKKTKNTLRRASGMVFPFLQWTGDLKKAGVFRSDCQAGLTVALIMIPQAMAYAQLAELPIHYGLYAAFLPVALGALLGSSRQLSTGPVAIVSLLSAAAVGELNPSGSEAFIAYSVTLALIVGLIQLGMGLFRMGILVDFISYPLVISFTSAAAIIISTSQVGKIFGLYLDRVGDEMHYRTLFRMAQTITTDLHWPTVGMSILALTVILFFRYLLPKWPAILVSVVTTTAISYFFNYAEHGGKIIGFVPSGLPTLQPPSFDFEIFRKLVGPGIAITLIGFLETISIAKAVAASTRNTIDTEQELIGQGIANLGSSCTQGYVVSGSFSRTAANHQAGAITGLSSVVTSIIIGVTLLFLTPLIYHLPQPTLAVAIIYSVLHLVRFKPILEIWKVQKHDFFVCIIVFSLTLIYAPNLEWGILIGMLLSLGLFVYRNMHPRFIIFSRHSDGRFLNAETNILAVCPKVEIIGFSGSLFFANSGYFQDKILRRVARNPQLRCLIVDAVSMNEIDTTGAQMLLELSHKLVEQHVELLFVRTQPSVLGTLRNSKFLTGKWSDHFYAYRIEALKFAWKIIRSSKEEFKCSISGCNKEDCSSCVLNFHPRLESSPPPHQNLTGK